MMFASSRVRGGAVVALSLLALTACSKTTYKHKDAPDEFAISRNAPLIVPPDYTLAPPRPGQPRPLGTDSQSQAVDALFGPGTKAPPKSASETSLLDQAGATKPDPTVRSTVGNPNTPTVDKGAFLQELLSAKPGSANPAVASVAITG
jgi:hypothetical protein